MHVRSEVVISFKRKKKQKKGSIVVQNAHDIRNCDDKDAIKSKDFSKEKEKQTWKKAQRSYQGRMIRVNMTLKKICMKA